jgi:hypothetical protein
MRYNLLSRPIYRLIISTLLFIISIFIAYDIYIKYKLKYEVHNTERLSEILTTNTYHDVLFLGSSRVHYSLNPKIIDSICNVNSYNLGVEGGDMYEFAMILASYLEHHSAPKYIFLNFDMHSFFGKKKIYNYPIYFPFANKNKTIKSYLKENRYYKIQYDYFPFLEFADFDDNSKGYFLKGLIGLTEISYPDFQYKGYLSNTNVQITDTNIFIPQKDLSVSGLKFKCLEQIIQICKQKGIVLFFFYAPEFNKKYQNSILNKDQIFKIVDSLSKTNKISFFRDDNLHLSYNQKYFANTTHLNINGAQVYSTVFSYRLKKILKN